MWSWLLPSDITCLTEFKPQNQYKGGKRKTQESCLLTPLVSYGMHNPHTRTQHTHTFKNISTIDLIICHCSINLLKDTQLFWFSLLVTDESSKNLFNLCKLNFLLSIPQLVLDQKWNFYKLQYFAFSGAMGFVVLIVFASVSWKISEKNNHWIHELWEFSRRVSNSLCFSSVNTNKLVMLVLQARVFLISVTTVRWLCGSSRISWAPASVPTDSVHLIGRWKNLFQSW